MKVGGWVHPQHVVLCRQLRLVTQDPNEVACLGGSQIGDTGPANFTRGLAKKDLETR